MANDILSTKISVRLSSSQANARQSNGGNHRRRIFKFLQKPILFFLRVSSHGDRFAIDIHSTCCALCHEFAWKGIRNWSLSARSLMRGHLLSLRFDRRSPLSKSTLVDLHALAGQAQWSRKVSLPSLISERWTTWSKHCPNFMGMTRRILVTLADAVGGVIRRWWVPEGTLGRRSSSMHRK